MLGGGWCLRLLHVGMKGSGFIGQCSAHGLLLAAARQKGMSVVDPLHPTRGMHFGLHDCYPSSSSNAPVW